jgi:hypothetical protein
MMTLATGEPDAFVVKSYQVKSNQNKLQEKENFANQG